MIKTWQKMYKKYSFARGISWKNIPDSNVHGANMGPTWVLPAPDGPHVGPTNLAIRDVLCWLHEVWFSTVKALVGWLDGLLVVRLFGWFVGWLAVWLVISRHDDVIKWKHFPRNWPFVRGIHRFPVNSPHKGRWRGALMFSLICVWINGWVNNGEAGDLRRYRAHYDVTVMIFNEDTCSRRHHRHSGSVSHASVLFRELCRSTPRNPVYVLLDAVLCQCQVGRQMLDAWPI